MRHDWAISGENALRRGKQHRLRIGRVSERGQYYFVTTCTYERERLLDREASFRVLCDTVGLLESAELARTECFVAMPDHLHMVLQLIGDGTLPQAMNRLKGVSSRAINLVLSRQGPVWQRAYHDSTLRDDRALTATMRYAWHNPVAAGIVAHPREYPYWWSRGG